VTGWREFDQNLVSHSAAHHLTTIQFLLDEFGYARVSDVARHLGITRGSVSVTLKGLRQRGLVIEDEHKHLGLSDEGIRIARGIHIKRILIQTLFHDILGIDAELAEQDACKVEHLLSDETAEAVARLLQKIESGKTSQQLQKMMKETGKASPGATSDFPSETVQEFADSLEQRQIEREDETK
jgi:Mn-dependent DtxR family transcriptional regulator